MRNKILLFGMPAILAAAAAPGLLQSRAAAAPDAAAEAAHFTVGGAVYKSLGPVAFSPAGVLYIADDRGGGVIGLALDERQRDAAPRAKVADLGRRIAGAMGADEKGIEIRDMAISPVSGDVYLTVRKLDGADNSALNPANYLLFRVTAPGQVEAVDTASLRGRRVEIAARAGYGQREGNPYVIGDLVCAPGRLLVPALSSEAFSSNLHSLPLPLGSGDADRFATSIYHVSHKRQETASPIQTLTLYRDAAGQPLLVAAYVCTPVVRIRLEDLKPNATATGVTVAELGSGNRPMKMVSYGPPGRQSLLLDNSSFGKLKVAPEVVMEEQAVNEKTAADRGSRGQTSHPGIQPAPQLARAQVYAPSGNDLVVVTAGESGMSLETVPAP